MCLLVLKIHRDWLTVHVKVPDKAEALRIGVTSLNMLFFLKLDPILFKNAQGLLSLHHNQLILFQEISL